MFRRLHCVFLRAGSVMAIVLPLMVFPLVAFSLVVFSLVARGEITEALFVVNETSRKGSCGVNWPDVEALLQEQGFIPKTMSPMDGTLPYSVEKTTKRGSATKTARDYYQYWQKEQPQDSGNKLLVVAVGGDGTLSEVVQKFDRNDGVIFGVLPCGSGNDVGHNLGISRSRMQDAVSTLRWGKPMTYGAYRFTAAPFQNDVVEEVKDKAAGDGSGDGSGEEQQQSLKEGWVIEEFDLGRGAEAGRLKYLREKGEPVSPLVRWSPNALIYPAASVAAWFKRKPVPVSVAFDQNDPVDMDMNLLIGTCGPYAGGGLCMNSDMKPGSDLGSVLYGSGQGRYQELASLLQLGAA